MIRVHPQFRDGYEALVATCDTLVAVCALPATLDPKEALERETARRIASFTQRLCAKETLD